MKSLEPFINRASEAAVIHLSALDSKIIVDLLTKSAEPSPYLQKAAKEYRQSSVRMLFR